MAVLLFLDVSGGELLVVLLFVLLFFGSKGVPDVARTMGRAMRQLRDATADVQREIEKGASDVKKGYEQQRQVFRIEPPENAAPQKKVAADVVPAVPPTPEEPQVASVAETTIPTDKPGAD
ncbi:MAG: twin-arginine translocase TatA/TatE family subunit [Flavobacteriales bacterium]|nr:twin-arginine translocase TatA/TatE family subunit [Flavobacteriales bacterium]